MSGVHVFFKDKWFNPFFAAGSSQTVIDEFNGDNFHHGGLGFFGGGYIYSNGTGAARLISGCFRPAPRCGELRGSKRVPTGTRALSTSTFMAAGIRTAKITSTSIRHTPMPTVSRCCE
jgi:hypothetical protein